jgi:hypothetical protein
VSNKASSGSACTTFVLERCRTRRLKWRRNDFPAALALYQPVIPRVRALGRSQPEAHRAGPAVSSPASIHGCFELFPPERSGHQGKYGALTTVIKAANRHSNDRAFRHKSHHSIGRVPMSEDALHGVISPKLLATAWRVRARVPVTASAPSSRWLPKPVAAPF